MNVFLVGFFRPITRGSSQEALSPVGVFNKVGKIAQEARPRALSPVGVDAIRHKASPT
jgi:hypothetical protein